MTAKISLLLSTLLLLLLRGTTLAQAPEADSLDVPLLEVDNTDSLVTAGAGMRSGVNLDTRGVVYLNIFYQGVQYGNRVARGIVVTAADSTCRLKILESTAPVRPGYRVLLYGLRPAPPYVATTFERKAAVKKPFYKRRWFWIAGGAAAATAILAATSGGGKSGPSSSRGTVAITGSLP
ncbi:MAG: hypothetical protein A3F83_06470 [Candidatus Glassbacteria bacterium RIFCSPLOWO2_12_FULL_58_11]|uniref:Uncharacterized protein n=1 Tax=Candidatus Glassbacteria bacterium RIFCSPLOWO2_12_FULL_58_11 TaxID=1817867 RepID=A0A1F5YL83_9BACT|nr:MAG: hypothetical protein A3F83_06470 [Candidatus Glassbacteria bacterium RIFCSPLOWO2_12_FULL_58_11]